MSQVYLRFHGTLNDFLPVALRHIPIAVALQGVTAVKHPIESLGVPHPEIEQIWVNSQSVDFGYWVQADDQIELYPMGVEAISKPGMLLRPLLTPPLRFILDTHLGQLATYLRLFGFDTLYRNDYHDAELAQIAHAETRILLTRDRGLLKRKLVVYGYCVRTGAPRQQLIEVLCRYHLTDAMALWQRCLRCNGHLTVVAKETIFDQLEPRTQRYYEDFHRCQSCGQIYWQGSHHTQMQAFIDDVLREVSGPDQGRE